VRVDWEILFGFTGVMFPIHWDLMSRVVFYRHVQRFQHIDSVCLLTCSGSIPGAQWESVIYESQWNGSVCGETLAVIDEYPLVKLHFPV